MEQFRRVANAYFVRPPARPPRPAAPPQSRCAAADTLLLPRRRC